MKRAVVVLLVAALVLGSAGVLLSALGGRDQESSGRPEPGPPPSPQPGAAEGAPARLAPFYEQELDWQPCDDDECATLTVPLDYDEPGGRTIDLAVLRVPATGERLAALVVNPGGPGSPGTTYAAGAANFFGKPLLEHYDVVGFDPRGTGDSAPVDCLSDEQLDGYLAADPSPDDAAERADLVGWSRTFGRGCVDSDPELATHISTIEAARDLDVLRAALGRTALDYFGASYGTKLGATYAELFPDRVGRFVLDGAVDVSLSSEQLSLGQAGGFERALRAYVEDCVETVDGCFLGDSVDEGLGKITDLLDQVDAEPLPTTTDRRLTQGLAFLGITTPLYSRDSWFALTAGLRAAFNGNGSLLLQFADLYASRELDGSYSTNQAEAFPAISCLDDPASVTPRQVERRLPEFERVSPTLGDVFAWGGVSCSGQVATSTEEPLRIDGAGAAPILVVGTTRDPATPYEWSQALADQLESGVLLTRDGDGHTGYLSGNDCVDDTVEAYLLEGTVPEDGRTC